MTNSNPALKLDVLIWHPSYGGNGGISSEVPDIREWEVETVIKMKADPRVGKIHQRTVADTPITMVRNQAVVEARRLNAHLILMVDSDQNPQLWKTIPNGKPFWDVAFDEIYNHYGKGPLVIGAPYCGPPPHENIYVFQWENEMVIGDETPISLEQYTRAEASKMAGVQECAALPTGMILYDVRAFELIEPGDTGHPGWFYYDWTDSTASQKASTEDVTNTRDISIAGQIKLGYNPLRCAWDCWVGHWKPWCVGKPRLYTTDDIAESFKRAVLSNRQSGDRKIEVDFLDDLNIKPEMIRKPGSNGKGPALPLSVEQARHKLPMMTPHGWSYLQRNTYFDNLVSWPVYSFGHFNIIDDYETLTELLAEVRQMDWYSPDDGITIVEIGSWVGESAVAMAREISPWDDGSEIYCVDTFMGNKEDHTASLAEFAGGHDGLFDIFRMNTGSYFEKLIFPIGSTSQNAATQWAANRNPPIDFLFIDANHQYEAVKTDITKWLNLMSDHGVMVGHDYKNSAFPGVTQAVDEIFGDAVTCHGEYNGFWRVDLRRYRSKNNEPARPEESPEDSTVPSQS